MTVLLSVQFRNLLPSEELLRSARTLWNELDLPRAAACGDAEDSGDAHLSITQRSGKHGHYEVELSVPGAEHSASACGADAQLAIESVFRQVARRSGTDISRCIALSRAADGLAKASG